MILWPPPFWSWGGPWPLGPPPIYAPAWIAFEIYLSKIVNILRLFKKLRKPKIKKQNKNIKSG